MFPRSGLLILFVTTGSYSEALAQPFCAFPQEQHRTVVCNVETVGNPVIALGPEAEVLYRREDYELFIECKRSVRCNDTITTVYAPGSCKGPPGERYVRGCSTIKPGQEISLEVDAVIELYSGPDLGDITLGGDHFDWKKHCETELDGKLAAAFQEAAESACGAYFGPGRLALAEGQGCCQAQGQDITPVPPLRPVCPSPSF